jgi:alkylation response protein AidB-like acyl-CoA dehydrogenase
MSERRSGICKDPRSVCRPIGNFQHNAFKLAEMATEVQIGRTFLNTLIAEFNNGENITTNVSMAKAWLAEMAKQGCISGGPTAWGIWLHGRIQNLPSLPRCPCFADYSRYYRDYETYCSPSTGTDPRLIRSIFGRIKIFLKEQCSYG